MDTDAKADNAWLLGMQRKLYQWSRENPEGAYRELWGWVTDLRNLRCAWRTVASSKGRRMPGIDGVTVKHIRKFGEAKYLEGIKEELRQGTYRPSPSWRKWIPKPGKPGEFRPLGIATLKDRMVQCAVKQIIEPLFEARFWQVSYGFRSGRSCHGALEHIRRALTAPTVAHDGKRHANPYPWVIEGDISIVSCSIRFWRESVAAVLTARSSGSSVRFSRRASLLKISSFVPMQGPLKEVYPPVQINHLISSKTLSEVNAGDALMALVGCAFTSDNTAIQNVRGIAKQSLLHIMGVAYEHRAFARINRLVGTRALPSPLWQADNQVL